MAPSKIAATTDESPPEDSPTPLDETEISEDLSGVAIDLVDALQDDEAPSDAPSKPSRDAGADSNKDPIDAKPKPITKASTPTADGTTIASKTASSKTPSSCAMTLRPRPKSAPRKQPERSRSNTKSTLPKRRSTLHQEPQKRSKKILLGEEPTSASQVTVRTSNKTEALLDRQEAKPRVKTRSMSPKPSKKTPPSVETVKSGSSEPETEHSDDSDDEPPARGRGKVFPSGRARTAEDDAEDAKPKRGGRKKQTARMSTEGPAPTVQYATNAMSLRDCSWHHLYQDKPKSPAKPRGRSSAPSAKPRASSAKAPSKPRHSSKSPPKVSLETKPLDISSTKP